MKPLIHAKNSARKHGGTWEDYIEIHNFMDSSKAACASMHHRAIFHSAFGIFIVEKTFGVSMKNSEGKLVSIRDLAEDHVIEDLGFIPSLDHWLGNMTSQDWMFGGRRKQTNNKFIKID